MWVIGFLASIGILVLTAVVSILMNGIYVAKKRTFNVFRSLFAGVFLATLVMFFTLHCAADQAGPMGIWWSFLVSVFHAMQVFTIGCDFEVVKDGISSCPQWLGMAYQAWAATLYVVAPIFTFGFVLSLFKNISAYLHLFMAHFKDLYVFSELNEKSLILAGDIKKNNQKAAIVFTDVFDDNAESTCELIEAAKKIGAICFEKDVLAIDFRKHSHRTALFFFTIGRDETENLNQSLKLIENYKNRADTHVYIFSTGIESELLLTSVDKGTIKVRRINDVQALVNRVLYERGNILFDSAKETEDGSKHICAVVIGMGKHGTAMLKALTWFGQMDGYKLEIHAFDQDPLAQEKFTAMAPELMSPAYNGIDVPGEAQYRITIHSGVQVGTITFADEISKITNATYVIVALGNDDINIKTAVDLRMYFERMKIHPVIQSIVYNSQQKRALEGICNYRGQAYDIEFIGDLESSYTQDVIIDSELEEEALRRHLKWGEEEEFWTYQYNYCSSVASAIHMRARIRCGIPGAAKKEEELTEKERDTIETLEHRRWNAYMRAEGYVYSGSKDKKSRNDLAKMHHDLVDYSALSESEKRKDSKVGTY